ncbi:unnamed protein product [Phytophthora fragariaefolia]|uniref:Unnamed protein product n=1 Tax=Phytophthora fragariaefolia TaxID=1490495 RepID=A0A9W6TTU0_9STRA|nr:unnamed protein product [Phytophthora fragariaefolia]
MNGDHTACGPPDSADPPGVPEEAGVTGADAPDDAEIGGRDGITSCIAPNFSRKRVKAACIVDAVAEPVPWKQSCDGRSTPSTHGAGEAAPRPQQPASSALELSWLLQAA